MRSIYQPKIIDGDTVIIDLAQALPPGAPKPERSREMGTTITVIIRLRNGKGTVNSSRG